MCKVGFEHQVKKGMMASVNGDGEKKCLQCKILMWNCIFYAQHFADVLAAEADDRDVEAELVDLSQCEPEDDLIVTVLVVVNLFKQLLYVVQSNF